MTGARRGGARRRLLARRTAAGVSLTARPTPAASEPRARRGAALVRPRRAGALPLAARAGAVHRRRLGHPRRLPGTGRPAHRARPSTTSVRDVLLRVFRAQNARGDWPQAFDFLPPLPSSGQQDSHGDVVYWPLLACGDYLRATGDASLLHERGADRRGRRSHRAAAGPRPPAPGRRRASRTARSRAARCPPTATATGTTRCSPPTRRSRPRLVSTWTASSSRRRCARSPRASAPPGRPATSPTRQLAVAARTATRRRPAIAARARRRRGAARLRPASATTAPSSCSSTRGHAHRAHLRRAAVDPRDLRRPAHPGRGPAPPRPHRASTCSGPTARASSTARRLLRRADARSSSGPRRAPSGAARSGSCTCTRTCATPRRSPGSVTPTALLTALAKASPVGVETLVPQARPRQTQLLLLLLRRRLRRPLRRPGAVCRAARRHVPLEGGWRVYSSGPGLVLRLVVEVLLGFRARHDGVEVDPVLPAGLDGLVAHVPVAGRSAVVRLRGRAARARSASRSPSGGRELALTPLTNPYRDPGVCVAVADLAGAARRAAEPLEIDVETTDMNRRPVPPRRRSGRGSMPRCARDARRAAARRMTLEEKVGQTHMVANVDPDADADALRAGAVGASLYASGATAGNVRDEGVLVGNIDAAQRNAVAESRLGIPVLFGRDVIHGHRTVFPDPARARRVLRRGPRRGGRRRSPRGRPPSTASRGPSPRWSTCPRSRAGAGSPSRSASRRCSSGRLGAAIVRGLQGTDAGDTAGPDRLGACAKHFVGYGLAAGRA